jgi:hypothetical protein
MDPRKSIRDLLVLEALLCRAWVAEDEVGDSMVVSRSCNGIAEYLDSFCGGANRAGRARPRLERKNPHVISANTNVCRGRSRGSLSKA